MKRKAKHNILTNSKSLSRSDAGIRAALIPFHADFTDEQVKQVRSYLEKLCLWNQRVNLTSIRKPADILARHFGESIFGASFLPAGRSLIDVGSGAGFPGLALRLIVPDLRLTLVEPNVKKATFLAEVIRELRIANVRIIRSKFEEMRSSDYRTDAITTRAFGDYSALVSWAKETLLPGGRLLLWLGGDVAGELRRDPSWRWTETAIPRSTQRILLCGELAG